MIVVKFGGSSLAGAQRMLAAARIVASHTRSEPVVCVVSAMAGVTDQLITIANQALAGTHRPGKGRTPICAPGTKRHVAALARLPHETAFRSLAPSGTCWKRTPQRWRPMARDTRDRGRSRLLRLGRTALGASLSGGAGPRWP